MKMKEPRRARRYQKLEELKMDEPDRETGGGRGWKKD
jgi:hypothetical protein